MAVASSALHTPFKTAAQQSATEQVDVLHSTSALAAVGRVLLPSANHGLALPVPARLVPSQSCIRKCAVTQVCTNALLSIGVKVSCQAWTHVSGLVGMYA